jgi:hypothetical protein
LGKTHDPRSRWHLGEEELSEDTIKNIDPNGLYTVEQAAKLLMEVDPSYTLEEAIRKVRTAIAADELPIAGYLSS